ncbi:MAG TPA: PaaI family thioesterase [Candidatus Acidoferrum sp.]|nr:PaaI family thioesterase [Candidatus Acidoferrum sp.]
MTEPSGFEPQDPAYQSRVQNSFIRQGLMLHLGAELTALRPGDVEIRVPFRRELTQQHHFFHAGVTGAIADSACGYAAYTLMPADSSVLTVEYKMNLLEPADGEELIARARVIRTGKTLTICLADVFVRKGGAEKHCATMLSTVMCMTGRADRPR